VHGRKLREELDERLRARDNRNGRCS
jgi:hypothetical protein